MEINKYKNTESDRNHKTKQLIAIGKLLLQDVRATRGAIIGSDHFLIIGKIRVK